MSLPSGTKLGPYEIQSALGAGGMGEVYRARDARLGREVAIKVLPESFARDADRLRRFEQEARTVAALNHPNILAVYDIGEYQGSPYIVCELLDGETLREKMDEGGAIAQRRAVEYASQIAEGVAAAHEKGIVHRDLKPENVFVTTDAHVKILDFGLAKLARAEAAAADGITATLALHTTPGMVLGTAGYMSPEQVRGKEVDARTDIFAFGAILYEMVSGGRAFKGSSSVETMNAILKEEPPELDAEKLKISSGLERIIRRCLEKEPARRFQSARDVGFALEAISGSSPSSPVHPAVELRSPRVWMVLLSCLAAIVAVTVSYYVGAHRTRVPASFERITFQRGYIRGARFAPGGQDVIYSAAWEGQPYEVFTSRIGDHNARPLDLKNAMVVGVSANGDVAVLINVQRIRESNWMQEGTLARAPAGGGAPRELLDEVWDADMSSDGKEFAVVRKPGGPQQLEYPIGKVLFKTNGYISHPRISPDGKLVAFFEHPVYGDDRGYLDLVDTNGNAKRITSQYSAGEGLSWAPDGREIWYGAAGSETDQDRAVFAVTPAGKSREIFHVPGDAAVWDISADGRALLSEENLSSAEMVASPSNQPERNVSALGWASNGAVSDNGKTMVFTEAGKGVPDDYLVFCRHLDNSAAVEIGEGSTLGITPDGKYAVALVPSQPTKLRILPTGAGEARTLDVSPIQVDPDFVSWMPGAKEFVFLGTAGDAGPPRAYRISLEGGPAHPLTNQQGAHFWNRVSPDGRFVLEAPSVGNEWGENAVVDLLTDKSQPARLLQGDEPIGWGADAKHAFVVRITGPEATIFRVDVTSGKREVWKQIRSADPAGILSLAHFFVTPSGNAYSYTAARVLSALYAYSQPK